MKPSEYVGKIEQRIIRKTKRIKKRMAGRLAGTLIPGLIFWYFYGMIINLIHRGIFSVFGNSGEPGWAAWEFNPFVNWFAVFTPTGLGVTAICIIFIILFSKKVYHWLSGYRFVRDKRGFDIWPDGTHGTSGWLKPQEMETVCDVGEVGEITTTLLGKYKDDPEEDDQYAEYVGLKEKNGLNKNMAVFGASGAGKSRGFVKPLILQAARRKESLVLVDSKGEFYESMSGFLADEGYVVKCFNLIDMTHSDSFNCFGAIQDSPEMAVKIAQIIMENTQISESNNPFWDISEQNLLTALILYISQENLPIERRALADVYGLLSTVKFSAVAKLLEGLDKKHPAHAPFTVFSQANESVWGNVAAGLGVRLQIFADPMAGRITRFDEIDFALPGEKPCAYFCVIPDQDNSKSFLSALFFQILFERLYDLARKQGGALPVPVNVVLDEFCNVGKFPKFVETISTSRSRNINIQIILQSLPQLVARYGRDESGAILTNCDTQIFLGCNDLNTAQYFSDKIGAVTIRVNNNQMPMAPLFTPINSTTRPYSQTRSNVGRELMMTDEILRLPNEECLVSLRGQKPMRLCKIIPDELPGFDRLRTVSVLAHTPGWTSAPEVPALADELADLPQEDGDGSASRKPAEKTRSTSPSRQYAPAKETASNTVDQGVLREYYDAVDRGEM